MTKHTSRIWVFLAFKPRRHSTKISDKIRRSLLYLVITTGEISQRLSPVYDNIFLEKSIPLYSQVQDLPVVTHLAIQQQ